MKKTVSANISGIIFNMDDDAYEKLQQYFTSVRSHFSASDGRDEIIADIEARIAEMFQQRVSDRKQVITHKEVEEIITIMGRPEDISGETADAGAGQKEPSSRQEPERKYRRLYRDPDDRVLGGVCSGVAHYFGFDPLWLRLAFAAALFFAGTGVLLYILLWIIIPKASTTAEKLEMKGERVNISNISKSIEEEMDYLKKKLNEIKDDAKKINTKPIADKAENIFERFFNFLGELVRGIFKGFLHLLGFILLVIGIILLVFLGISFLGGYTFISVTEGDFHAFSWPAILHFFFDSPRQVWLLKIGGILLIGIPVFLMIYEGFKLLFRVKTKTHIVGISAFALWLAGWIICGIVVMAMVKDFSTRATDRKEIGLLQPPGNTMYLRVLTDSIADGDEGNDHINITIDHHRLLYRADGKVYLGYVQFDVEKSENDSFKLMLKKVARGETLKEAKFRAENVAYHFSQSDSSMALTPYFTIDETSKWRAQQLKFTLKVPAGKSIFLENSMDEIIYDVKNVDNVLDEDMVGKKWKMTDGGLVRDN